MSVPAYKSGVAMLPLHYGRAPAWLFARMQRLARSILVAVVEDFGPDEVLRRLADPFWFQALGCVLGYDWHSSGLTTTVCGAIKEGLTGLERELGLFIAGGKSREVQGVGQRTLRALSLIAELIYEARVSLRDPATFSFAHGGKDGHPYPVDREAYDSSIRFLSEALRRAKIGDSEKLAAFKRLKDNTAAMT
jgi:hypothetical protein